MRALITLAALSLTIGCSGHVAGDPPFPVPDGDAGVDPGGGGGEGGGGGCRAPEPQETWTYGYDDRDRLVTANQKVIRYDDDDRLEAIESPTTRQTFTRDVDGAWSAYRFESSGEGPTWSATVASRGPTELVVDYAGDRLSGFTAPAPAFDPTDHPELAEAAPSLDLGEQLVLALGAAEPDTDPPFVEFRATFRYDEDGRLVERVWTAAGSDEPLARVTIEYPGPELVVTTTEFLVEALAGSYVEALAGPPDAPERLTHDEHADGTIDRTKVWRRGPGWEEIDEDLSGDGQADRRTRLEFNPAGQRVLKTEDDGLDGRIDWRKRYVYDSQGRRLWEARDRDVNGLIDERWDYAYDEEGRLIEEVRTDPKVGECGVDWE